MAVNGKRTGIDRRDVDSVADRFAVPAASRIVEQVLAAVDGWRRYAGDAGVPDDVANGVAEDIAHWSAPLRRPRRGI